MTEAGSRGRALASLQWILVAAALGYAAVVHHGIGPAPTRQLGHWWEPRTFLIGSWVTPVLEPTGRALLCLVLPAVLLAVGVFLAGRSAIARGIALACVYATLLFTFYGVQAPFAWEFFHWRGSAVMAVMSLILGFATAAPFLARSWLALGWPLRLLLYLPVAFLILAFVCNATGTDPSLQYSISPWPAVSVFGIEVGALFVFTFLLGVATGLGGVAAARAGSRGSGVAAAAIAAGLAVPVLLLAAGSALSLLPFRLEARLATAVTFVCAILLVGGLLIGGKDPSGLRTRARNVAVGAALIGIPLAAGQAWALWDYHVTREVRARSIIDALETYLVREEVYPDELQELVAAGDIDELPEPRIGFGFLYDGRFRYQNFGSSFILEFPAPRWVECAYTPPYEDDDEDFFEDEDDVAAAPGEENGDPDVLDESWSCPSRPPELW